MKKYIRLAAFLLCALLLFTGCSRTQADEPSLYSRGLDVISLLSEMAGNDTWLDILTANESIQERITQAAASDYAQPSVVYQLSFPLAAASDLVNIPDFSALPESLRTALSHRLYPALVNQINAAAGAEALAAAASCTASKTFHSSACTTDMLYLYTFESGCPVAVVFTPGEDSTVTATATLLLNEDFPSHSPEDLRKYFSSDALEITTVSP